MSLVNIDCMMLAPTVDVPYRCRGYVDVTPQVMVAEQSRICSFLLTAPPVPFCTL